MFVVTVVAEYQMAMAVWRWCDCTSAVTRSCSDSSSCLLSFISIAINRYFRTPEGNERLGRTIHIFFGD